MGLCWVWTAGKHPKGYGTFSVNGKFYKAHRLSWVLKNGEIPTEKPNILHKCDNPSCVNPLHLFCGTNDDNIKDCVAKNRRKLLAESKGKPIMFGKDLRGGSIGENHYSSKLTAENVIQIRSRNSESMTKLAAEYNVTRNLIWMIQRRKIWTHI